MSEAFPRIEQPLARAFLECGSGSTEAPNLLWKISTTKRLLQRIADANEFLSPYCLGSLSRFHGRMLRVEELEVAASSGWAGRPLDDIALQRDYNLLVLAVRRPVETGSSKFWVNPPTTLLLQPGSVVIVLGDLKDVSRARRDAA